MDPLLAARAQMEVSLGFHMIFAALGIGMPLLMVLAELLWRRTGREHYRELARTWGKATALLFAVGAVSGTALSFELGLLWPRFMEVAGARVGPAFALEGYAFFLEAIFIALYLYGWERLSARAHFFAGLGVSVCGLASGVLVVAANAWMQLPADEVFASPMWGVMSVHSSLACYAAVGFAVAGVYAIGMLRGRRDAYHHAGLAIPLAVGAVAAALQIVSGDASAKAVYQSEPVKLAAMEERHETMRGAPIEIAPGLEIPKGLSVLAAGDPEALVHGLDEVPEDERPNALVCHVAFLAMVGCGFAMLGTGTIAWLAFWRRRAFARPVLVIVALASPLGMIALEAGWTVTEVGRQPWIVHGLLRTSEAVTPVAGVQASLVAFGALYLALGAALALLLKNLAKKRHHA